MEQDVRLIRSDRRSISLQINPDLQVIVRAPRAMAQEEIDRFVTVHAAWIEAHLALARQRRALQPMTEAELNALFRAAREDLPSRVQAFAPQVGVDYGRVTIRNQTTRWGSCSSKGNLNFNCLLLLCPPQVRDYVVVHELCHRRQMNHSPAFWAEVARALPDYAQARAWLREHGAALLARLP